MSTQTQPAPVLAWHREAAAVAACDRYTDTIREEKRLAKIIAAHDPHQETVRLLGEALRVMDAYGTHNLGFRDEIRAHLASLQQEGAAK